MDYSIATNFDKELLEYINNNDKKGRIKYIYGKLSKDILGGGRASMILPSINIKELKEYITLCHKYNLKFNYLYNPMCIDNADVDMKQQKKILKYIDKLIEIGVDGFTINSPYLCRMLRERYKDIGITIGAYACVNSILQIKYWKEMGADEITLHPSVNRRFKLLESMLEYTKGKDIKLRLIANNVCLKDCPYQISHGTEQSHASKKKDRTIFFDLDLISCTYCKVSDGTKIITSEWIRPEDVKVYQNLCNKVGNQNLSIKLVERTKETKFLCRVVKAYVEEKYEGNLLEILNWPVKSEINKFDNFGFVTGLMLGGYNIKKARKFEQVFEMPYIYVDNKKLDGFINKFIEEDNCAFKECGSGTDHENNKCNYCSSWAKKVITYNEEQRKQWQGQVSAFLKNFDNGNITK